MLPGLSLFPLLACLPAACRCAHILAFHHRPRRISHRGLGRGGLSAAVSLSILPPPCLFSMSNPPPSQPISQQPQVLPFTTAASSTVFAAGSLPVSGHRRTASINSAMTTLTLDPSTLVAPAGIQSPFTPTADHSLLDPSLPHAGNHKRTNSMASYPSGSPTFHHPLPYATASPSPHLTSDNGSFGIVGTHSQTLPRATHHHGHRPHLGHRRGASMGSIASAQGFGSSGPVTFPPDPTVYPAHLDSSPIRHPSLDRINRKKTPYSVDQWNGPNTLQTLRVKYSLHNDANAMAFQSNSASFDPAMQPPQLDSIDHGSPAAPAFGFPPSQKDLVLSREASFSSVANSTHTNNSNGSNFGLAELPDPNAYPPFHMNPPIDSQTPAVFSQDPAAAAQGSSADPASMFVDMAPSVGAGIAGAESGATGAPDVAAPSVYPGAMPTAEYRDGYMQGYGPGGAQPVHPSYLAAQASAGGQLQASFTAMGTPFLHQVSVYGQHSTSYDGNAPYPGPGAIDPQAAQSAYMSTQVPPAQQSQYQHLQHLQHLQHQQHILHQHQQHLQQLKMPHPAAAAAGDHAAAYAAAKMNLGPNVLGVQSSAGAYGPSPSNMYISSNAKAEINGVIKPQVAAQPKVESDPSLDRDHDGKNLPRDDDDDDDEYSGEDVDDDLDDGSTGEKRSHECKWVECTLIFTSMNDLVAHIMDKHVGGGKPNYICDWKGCGRDRRPFVKRHKIQNHIRIHTGERPFACTVPGCDKTFSRQDGLNTHIKREFKDDIVVFCRALLVRFLLARLWLLTHVLRDYPSCPMQTHSNVKPFVCAVPNCGKAYYHSRSLRKHEKSHQSGQGYEDYDMSGPDDNGHSLQESGPGFDGRMAPVVAPIPPPHVVGADPMCRRLNIPMEDVIVPSQFTIAPPEPTTVAWNAYL
ncbi:uncharacterized protein BJ171DRAFT_571507 [Polychytrium aggregatum]|uniref:uncharacterized protein n=1 Tax=Polychytrium aggregatum TaxID=110093 RepID=UPI0022FEF557|nr:uncharacterized protein BJ171DRAFT_571507 [Polychytrium aggregatum]KAI9193702.1 hypothetical protein BJ171DRAFT_571507 [Polychytrium aggregatum]